MKFRKAERKQLKARISVEGASGHGKTRAALKLAYGLCGDWNKIAVADTEYESSEMHVGTNYDGFEIGSYWIGDIEPAYTADKFLDAIVSAEKAGMEVLIIDNFSHEWEGEGGIYDMAQDLGGRFDHWKKPKKIHSRLIERFMHSPLHIIVTVRLKQEYVLETNSNGKQVPKKVGMKPQQSHDYDYLFTTVFRMEEGAYATVIKDRTHLFHDFHDRISVEHGQMLRDWLVEGKPVMSVQERKVSAIQFIGDMFRKHAGAKKLVNEALAKYQVKKLQDLTPGVLFDIEEQVREKVGQDQEQEAEQTA